MSTFFDFAILFASALVFYCGWRVGREYGAHEERRRYLNDAFHRMKRHNEALYRLQQAYDQEEKR